MSVLAVEHHHGVSPRVQVALSGIWKVSGATANDAIDLIPDILFETFPGIAEIFNDLLHDSFLILARSSQYRWTSVLLDILRSVAAHLVLDPRIRGIGLLQLKTEVVKRLSRRIGSSGSLKFPISNRWRLCISHKWSPMELLWSRRCHPCESLCSLSLFP